MMKIKATLLAHCLLASSKLKATLLAQRHVAGSIFLAKKKRKRKKNLAEIEPATCPWAGTPMRHEPGQYIVSIRFDALTFVRQLNVT